MGLLKALESWFFDSNSPDNGDGNDLSAAKRVPTTVLAIDDDPVFLGSMKQLLREAGFNVLTSSTAAKGLDVLNYAAHDVKLVVLDYGMPRLDGEKTLAYVRRLNPHVKIVGLTGYKQEDLPESYVKGVDRLIQKPFRSVDFVLALRELAGVRGDAAPVSA